MPQNKKICGVSENLIYQEIASETLMNMQVLWTKQAIKPDKPFLIEKQQSRNERTEGLASSVILS